MQEGRSHAEENPTSFHSNPPALPSMQGANHACAFHRRKSREGIHGAWDGCKTHAARVAPCETGGAANGSMRSPAGTHTHIHLHVPNHSLQGCQTLASLVCVPGCTCPCQVGGVAWFTTPAPLVPLPHRLERMRRRSFVPKAELHVRATTSFRFVPLPSHVRCFVANASYTRGQKQPSTKRHERRAHLIANPAVHVLFAWLPAPRRSSAACRHASRLLREAVPPPSWCALVRCEGGLLPLRLLPRRCRTAIRSNVRTHLPWPKLRRFVRVRSTETTP
mmetsp:Transcript_9785/g.59544  ORF Transcript_9785/g.59544 Transcript_9785/m.59544 type:complete len:277 (+) Transcript_9785:2371-3201(+)